MKLFISWSGEKARRVANALREFFQDVNHRILPWVSDSDISAGQRWAAELGRELDETDFGILCLTSESLDSPWVLFEAGALSRSVAGGRVCPYLIDVRKSQLIGPLSQFQAKDCSREQTWELLTAINLAMDDGALPDTRLAKYFDTFWGRLEAEIASSNRELQAPPGKLITDLLGILPPAITAVRQIESAAAMVDLPIWVINVNQAPFHVWREVIDVAVADRALDRLIRYLRSEYAGLADRLREPLEMAEAWIDGMRMADSSINATDGVHRGSSAVASSDSLRNNAQFRLSDPWSTELHRILCNAYGRVHEARFLLLSSTAAISESEIQFDGSVREVWLEILRLAALKGVLYDLVQAAANDPAIAAYHPHLQDILQNKLGQPQQAGR